MKSNSWRAGWSMLGLACLLTGLVRVPRAVAQQEDAPDPLPTLQLRLEDERGAPLEAFDAYWIYDLQAKKLPSTNPLSFPESSGVVVVRTQSGRFGGVILDSHAARQTTLRIFGPEADDRQLVTQPLPFDAALRQELLDQVERICWEELELESSRDLKPWLLQTLGTVNPKKTLRYLEEKRIGGTAAGMARQAAVTRLATTDFAAAVEALELTSEPMLRAVLWGRLAARLPPEDANLAIVESQWASVNREIQQPAMRLAHWANLGEHYLLRGQPEQTEKIVAQFLDDARQLPAGGWSGYPRSLFAALVAADDPLAARKLIEGIDANEQARAEGRVAFYACQHHPQFAKEFSQQIDKQNTIGFPYRTRVAHRMAIYHPEQAIAIAESIPDPKHSAWALGLVAQQLSSTDSERARNLLIEAVARNGEAHAEVRTYVSPATISAGLLPFTESIDGGKLAHRLWQSVWMTVPQTRWNDGGQPVAAVMENVAAGIARYDPALSRALLTGPTGIRFAREFDPQHVKNRLAIDPQGLLQALGEQPFSQRNFRSYEMLVDALALDNTSFWDQVSIPELLIRPTARYEEP